MCTQYFYTEGKHKPVSLTAQDNVHHLLLRFGEHGKCIGPNGTCWLHICLITIVSVGRLCASESLKQDQFGSEARYDVQAQNRMLTLV